MTEYKITESKMKLHLTSVDPGRKRLFAADKVYCRVNKKYGLMCLGVAAMDAMYIKKAWYKLAYDSTKNIIAWKIRKELLNDHLQETGWKYCDPKDRPVATISVGRILQTMNLKGESWGNLEIKKYRDKGLVGDGDDTNVWYFVQIEDSPEGANTD